MSREVAIKRVELNARSAKEAAALASLQHPNIVKILSVEFDEQSQGFLVLELVRGKSIQDVVRTNGPLPTADINRIALQALSALAHAHQSNVVHRDIKPHNMMLDDNGTLKILDFGIAKILGTADQRVTKTGEIVGTPQYISPEQCGAGEISPQTDIYLLACTLYFMATGHPPFEGETVMEVLYGHLHEPPDVSLIANERLRSILLKALSKKPDDRFSSANEMARAIADPTASFEMPLPDSNTAVTSRQRSESERITTKSLAPYMVAAIAIGMILLVVTVSMLMSAGPQKTASGKDAELVEVLKLAEQNPDSYINRINQNPELRKNPLSTEVLQRLAAKLEKMKHAVVKGDAVTARLIQCEEALALCFIERDLWTLAARPRAIAIDLRSRTDALDLSQVVTQAQELESAGKAQEAVNMLNPLLQRSSNRPVIKRFLTYVMLHFASHAHAEKERELALRAISSGDTEDLDEQMLSTVRTQIDLERFFGLRCSYVADYFLETAQSQKYPHLQSSALIIMGLRAISAEQFEIANADLAKAKSLAEECSKRHGLSENQLLLCQTNATEAQTWLDQLRHPHR